MFCKARYCHQPVISIKADKSKPAVKSGFDSDRTPSLISYSSTYGDYCYYHQKVVDNLIEGSIIANQFYQ